MLFESVDLSVEIIKRFKYDFYNSKYKILNYRLSRYQMLKKQYKIKDYQNI